MLILKETSVTISFDASIPCVFLHWHGFISGAKFKSAVICMLEFLRLNSSQDNPIQILADTRKLGIVDRKIVEWMSKEIDPLIYQYGTRKVAFMVPENNGTKVSIKQYKTTIKSNLHRLTPNEFYLMEEARDWLKQK